LRIGLSFHLEHERYESLDETPYLLRLALISYSSFANHKGSIDDFQLLKYWIIPLTRLTIPAINNPIVTKYVPPPGPLAAE